LPDTTYADLRYPASTNVPNIPQDIQNLASDLDQKVVVRVASPTARNALSAYAGMVVYEISTGRFWRRNTGNTAWDYAGGNPPPIVSIPLIAGWSVASASKTPGVYKDASGLVHLVGAVKNDSTYNPNDGLPHTALQLPVGFRPLVSWDVLVMTSTSVQGTIATDGILNFNFSPATSIATASFHNLGGIAPFHPAYTGSVPLA
jgi:hypothetical protein